jgi:hypothetical protein
LDSRIDISNSFISEEGSDALSVTSRIDGFRIFLSLLFGAPCIYFLYGVLASSSGNHPLFVIAACVFSPVLATLSLLFGFGVSKKKFNRRTREAHQLFQLFGFKREWASRIPKEGTVRLWEEWGHDERPALWFYVDIDGGHGLGFCIAGKYEKALQFAHKLAGFLSYTFVDQVSDDHRIQASRRCDGAG